jgi:hypothetical protein
MEDGDSDPLDPTETLKPYLRFVMSTLFSIESGRKNCAELSLGTCVPVEILQAKAVKVRKARRCGLDLVWIRGSVLEARSAIKAGFAGPAVIADVIANASCLRDSIHPMAAINWLG